MSETFLSSPEDVVRALLTYTDWWQPSTSSLLQVFRRNAWGDGMRAGLVEHLDERTELCRRMALLDDRERQLLYLWYVQQLTPIEIARAIHVSRRHCFRLRAKGVRALVELGDEEPAA